MGSGPPQLQRPNSVSSSKSEPSRAFQCPSQPTPVPQGREDLHGFAIRCVRSRMIPLFTIDGAQIGQRPCGARLVAGLSKGRKRMLIQLSGGGEIALFVGYVALLIDRPSRTAAIAEF